MTIHEIAEELNITKRAIKFYEEKGRNQLISAFFGAIIQPFESTVFVHTATLWAFPDKPTAGVGNPLPTEKWHAPAKSV